VVYVGHVRAIGRLGWEGGVERLRKTIIRSLFLCVLSLLYWNVGVAAPASKQIALTFDKLPYMEPLGYWTPREVSNMVLRALAARKIHAMGFVVEQKLDQKPGSYVVLLDWVQQGHKLGNETFGYVDLNELDASDFLAHVADGEKYTKRATHNVSGWLVRYFRFPMLHEGNTESKKKGVAQRLRGAGYVLVPATVLFTDYEFDFFLDNTADLDRSSRLEKLYLDRLQKAISYSESQSDEVFGRQIPQILRLHLGLAAGNFIEGVLDLLEHDGYNFTTVEEALKDPAYSTEENYVGPLGLSFIDRVAATKGLPYDEKAGEISRNEISKYLSSVGAQ
jgi:peptidoglycan/xylan/chitin deacetylase (PgdA/CDA1 family)